MKRLVGTTAMAAATVVIGHGLLQDYGVLTVVKRAGIAYLAAFAVTSLLVMIFRHGIQDDWIREENQRRFAEQKRKREARMAEEEARLNEQLKRSQETKQPEQAGGRKQTETAHSGV